MKQDKHILSVIDEIKNKDKVDINTLLHTGLSSRNTLYRKFCSLTGHTLNEYIRKNKLSKALALIKASDLPLAQIAADCGYSSQQALCREVRAYTQMTPLQYKESDVSHYLLPSVDGSNLQITTAVRTLPQTKRLKFMHKSLNSIENTAVNKFLSCSPGYSGIILGRNGKQDKNQYCYELYIDSESDCSKLSDDFIICNTASATTALYAAVTVKNDEEQINSAWDYLYGEWLSNSMYEYTGEPYFEEYILRSSRISKLRLYLPIRKKDDYTRITIENLTSMQFCVSSAKGYDAEKKASEQVTDFLSKNYPYLLRTVKEFYIQNECSGYTCGIRLKDPLYLPENKLVRQITTDSGMYGVLYGNFNCDYVKYRDILLQWLQCNGFKGDRVFSIYDTENGYDYPKIRLYCKLENKN